MDDGKENGSFDPEARSLGQGAGNDSGRPILAAALFVCLLLDACTNQQRAFVQRVVVPLAQIGLQVAANRGDISSGTTVLIGTGLDLGMAILMKDEAGTREQVVKLEEIGLAAAVQKGWLMPGDMILIQDASAIIQRAVSPAAMTTPPLALPPGKQPVSIAPASVPTPFAL